MNRIEIDNLFGKNMPEITKTKPLIAQGLHKEYGETSVLDDINVSINPGDKIGLIGRNGSGKTTLLKILAGLEQPDRGSLVDTGVRVGYLEQDYSFEFQKTIREVALSGVSHLIQALDKFEVMNKDFRVDDHSFMKEYKRVLDLLDTHQAYDLEDRLKRVLKSLGLSYPLDTRVENLSGGETVKLALAQLLITWPDILLLDEPTNHLDIHTNLWLRDFVKQWPGGLLVVSHDRDFLNDVTTSMWELEDANIRVFGGNYQFYKEQKGIEAEAKEREVIRLECEAKKGIRQIEKEQQRAAHSARRDLSKKPEDHDRYRAHYFKEKAAKTAGRKAKLAKKKKAEISEQLEKVRLSKRPIISPNIQESESHKGKVLLRVVNAEFGYGDRKVVENVNLTVRFSDRMALFGNNGVGKTTVIKGLLGLGNVKVEGNIQKTQEVNIQYLDQGYALVDRNLSVLDNLRFAAPNMSLPEVRQHLAEFLFMKTSDVYKKASVLSGGEVARLSLAMIAVMPIDLLILDEPTNNLDIESIEEIESVLSEFSGAILIITHDLSFLKRIGVSQSYVISNGKLLRLKGNPEDGESFKEELLKYI